MSEQCLLIGVHFLAPETRSYFLKLKELTYHTSSSFLAFASIWDSYLRTVELWVTERNHNRDALNKTPH